ncbi:MAG TPA: heat-inducible transcriptional repressor HrcA [Solirubrobacterales bacterium]|jgi:heat-inducible transcriptional repressor|nr:heat-inducible transcriptional repressor HrcA [Solirubrobacterales bacterium]
MLTERQQRILRGVVDSYLEFGQPVGSAAIAEMDEIAWSPSTVRAELAALERAGFLTHPHTSAGRVPTDAGYRFYADALLAAGAKLRASAEGGFDLSQMRREVEEALRETTSALSQANDLLAVATAPPPSSARIHRVEVLQLQPRVAMVVLIASNGAVTKRVFNFERRLDPGLVEWASSFLNERLSGLALGARMISDRLSDPELGPAESHFLNEIRDASAGLEDSVSDDLYVDGAARLLSTEHAADLPHAESLMRALERRANLLRVLRSALDQRSVFVWIGEENPAPELRSVSVVGANYGLGYRNLGTVGVVGPLRMNYATAIASVREAAGELSRFFESVYE